MAITARCPNCSASYNLRDEMKGKSVRCKKCEEMFTVGAAEAPTRAKGGTEIQAKSRNGSNGSSPKTPAAKTTLRRPDEEEEQPPRGSRAAAKPSKPAARHEDDDDEEDDQPPRSRRAATKPSKAVSRDEDEDNEDDEDDEDRPRKGKQGAKKGSGNKVLLIVGGILLVLFMMCGGAAFGIYYFVNRGANSAAAALGDLDRQIQEEMKKNGNVPIPQGVNVPQDIKVPQNFPTLTPSNEIKNIDDTLRDLKSTNDGQRQRAAQWLQKAPMDEARKVEVAKALCPCLEGGNGFLRADAATALKTWATKDVVPELAKSLAALGPGQQYGESVMEALGNLKDERGAVAVTPYLANAFFNEKATQSLQQMGQVAEKEVLKYYHHRDGGARERCRKLLTAYGTQPAAILKQTIDDLKPAPEKERRREAVQWLTKAPLDPSLQPEVAKALEVMLSDADKDLSRGAINALVLWATKDNVQVLVAQLSNQDNDLRRTAMQILGQLKDERAVVPVAEKLVPGTDRQQASKALIAMGKIVETEVRDKYLTHQDRAVSNEAANILKAIGSDGNIGLEQALAGLAAADAGRRRSSADTLQKTPLDPQKRADVAKALIKCLSDTDNGVAHAAAKALVTWADKTDVAQMLPAVSGPNANVRHAVMDTLSKLKDPQAVPPIVARLVIDGGDRKSASNALKAMGPIIQQPALYQALQSPDKHIKIEICHILQVAGTRNSMQVLNQVGIWASQPINPPRDRRPMHADVVTAVQQAMQACSTRQ